MWAAQISRVDSGSVSLSELAKFVLVEYVKQFAQAKATGF
jgi:hypothetical protein